MKSAQICNNWARWIATHIKFIMSGEFELDQTHRNVFQLGVAWVRKKTSGCESSLGKRVGFLAKQLWEQLFFFYLIEVLSNKLQHWASLAHREEKIRKD